MLSGLAFQGSLPPSSRLVHLNEQEIKQRWRWSCMDEQGAPDKNSNVKREHRRAGSEDRWLEYRGMGLAKPKPTWGLIRWGTCRSASCSHSDVTAGSRLWKMWACCWMGQGTWRQRTRKRMQYLEPSSTLVSADKISLQEPQVPDTSGKVWSKKDLPQWRRTRLGNT